MKDFLRQRRYTSQLRGRCFLRTLGKSLIAIRQSNRMSIKSMRLMAKSAGNGGQTARYWTITVK